MVLIINKSNAVVDFGKAYIMEENGCLLDNKTIYPLEILGLTLIENIEIPSHVKPQKFKLIDGYFIENLDYIEPEPLIREEISQMKEVVEYLVVSAFSDPS